MTAKREGAHTHTHTHTHRDIYIYIHTHTESRVQTRPKPSNFSGEKILSAPPFGEEVKPSVPCRNLRHVKEPKSEVVVVPFGKILGNFLAHISTFRCWGSLASFQTWGTPGGESWNVLITGLPSWGLDVSLATALCKNLPAENTQR